MSIRTTISKQFRWEMGHRLPHHEGLCRNIHGHGYEAHVTLTGFPAANGMVMDYFDVKTMVQPVIDELDHCFICDRHDAVMVAFFENHPMKVVYLDVPTTAENIAAMLLQSIVERLPGNHTLEAISVRVHETESTFAEVSVTL